MLQEINLLLQVAGLILKNNRICVYGENRGESFLILLKRKPENWLIQFWYHVSRSPHVFISNQQNKAPLYSTVLGDYDRVLG